MKIKCEVEVLPGTFLTDKDGTTWVIDTDGNAWCLPQFPGPRVYAPDFASDFERNHGPLTINKERRP